MPHDHIDDSTDMLERQASSRFIRHEEKAFVAGDPVQIVKAIARLDEQLLREEGRPAFSPPLDPDGYKPWGVGPQLLGKPRQALLAIPPEQVESIEISVYALGYWDVEIVPHEPSPQIGTMMTVGFLRFLGLPNARTEITFVCYEVGWDNLQRRWDQLQQELRDQGFLTPLADTKRSGNLRDKKQPGRKRHPSNEWAYHQVEYHGKSLLETVGPWLEMREAEGLEEPVEPLDALKKAIAYRKRKGENRKK